MTHFNTPEQFAAANKASLEQLMTLANSAVARAERLAALNLNTARAVLEDGVSSTRTLLAVKTPQELAQLQTTLAQPMIDKVLAYARSVYELATEGQQEIAKVFEAQIAELNKGFAAALEQASKSAPAGSEAAFAAVRNAMEAANSLYDSATKAARQATDMAEANVTAATEATVQAVKSASRKSA